jgi:hypothetical protein
MPAESEPQRPPRSVLEYAPPATGDWGLGISPRQKKIISDKTTRWAFWVAGVWLALALAMAGLAVWLAKGLVDDQNWAGLVVLILFIAAMLMCQAALLFVPVRVATRRPVVRRSLWPGVIAAGLLFGLLCFAGIWVMLAAWQGDHIDSGAGWDWTWLTIPAAVALWIAWAIFFLLAGRQRDPESITYRMQEYLIHGSVLELLIAVSAHVIVRNRGDCCAQFFTLIGIATGVAIMLVAFGPAVFILLVRRCRSLQPRGREVLPLDHPADPPTAL